MGKKIIKRLTPGRINRLFGLIMAIFLGLGGILYWFDYVRPLGLILTGIIALVAEISFVIGIRFVQKDGFLDGYDRAKDELNNKKKV